MELISGMWNIIIFPILFYIAFMAILTIVKFLMLDSDYLAIYLDKHTGWIKFIRNLKHKKQINQIENNSNSDLNFKLENVKQDIKTSSENLNKRSNIINKAA